MSEIKKILVVGKGGFVSNSFVRYMDKFGTEYQITVVSSMNHEWEQCDFTGFDAVHNASGLAHANAKDGSDELYYEVNGRLPGEIAAKAKAERVPVYVTISSQIIYGDMSGIGKKQVISADTEPIPEAYTVRAR